MIFWKKFHKGLIFIIVFILFVTVAQNIPSQITSGHSSSVVPFSRTYEVIFNETGLPKNTSWTVRLIANNSANFSYTSNSSTIIFNETNG
ncbi:MAG: hypothetical protein ACP5TX_06575, partial [Thermoplasmata archaeon]